MRKELHRLLNFLRHNNYVMFPPRSYLASQLKSFAASYAAAISTSQPITSFWLCHRGGQVNANYFCLALTNHFTLLSSCGHYLSNQCTCLLSNPQLIYPISAILFFFIVVPKPIVTSVSNTQYILVYTLYTV